MNVFFQYIPDIQQLTVNVRFGAGSGLLAAANIREYCTSGVTPKADVQGFSLNFRNVLFSDVQGFGLQSGVCARMSGNS
jgi:hypothetical protein